mmetsp:Transcript_111305/g.346978  ORF Transcript_111305/g.346978 Transcript_111305/m.346978 type:complete len:330 (+) Transcript_111305:31-1020(+)
MLTNDLIRALCSKLGHEEGAGPCVKKLVSEHWLKTADDLRYVPRARLESWGVPLKLIAELEDFLTDEEATRTLAGFQGFMNYRVRPALATWFSMTRLLGRRSDGEEERELDPEAWAAKKLQRWYRARRARRLWEMSRLNEVMGDWLEKEDFSRPSEEEIQARRERRALAKLRGFVRRWHERRQQRLALGEAASPPRLSTGAAVAELLAESGLADALGGADQQPMADLLDPSAVPAQLLRISAGQLKDCNVMHLVRRIAQEAGHTEAEVKPCAHRLVTLNWLEDIADLDLVEDRHWEAWAVPEKVVIECKAAARGYMQDHYVRQWCGWGS